MDGRKGVFVTVGVSVTVGLREAVPVRILGVVLPVGVKKPRVAVDVAVMGVLVGVELMALGSGASPTAIRPRQ